MKGSVKICSSPNMNSHWFKVRNYSSEAKTVISFRMLLIDNFTKVYILYCTEVAPIRCAGHFHWTKMTISFLWRIKDMKYKQYRYMLSKTLAYTWTKGVIYVTSHLSALGN